jgi:methyl-accepting chemotaxis protein
MKIRWFGQVRTKLFASLILLTSTTIVACGVSVWLFDGFSSLFSRTIRRDFATFGSMVRLQEVAAQLVQLTTSLGASVREGQLAPVIDAIAAGQEKAAYAVVVLRRDPQMADEVDGIATKLDNVFSALKTAEELSAKRIAAVERRASASGGLLPALDNLEEALDGKGDAIGLVELYRAAALGGALLSEAPLAGTIDLAHSLRTRFDVEADTLERLAARVAADAPKVAQAAKALATLGRGPDNLFDLREAELQAIALESQGIRPARDAAASLSAEFGGIVEEKRHDLDEVMRSSAARTESTRLFLIIVAACSVAPVLALALVYVSRSVAGRLRRLAFAMTALAGGDTRIAVPTAGARDEIGGMADALQFFKRQTIGAQELAREVTESIRQVALAAGQATSAIGQVSGGANTQLTALRHVANGLQQSADAITLVAANTQSARERAQQMAGLVEHGRKEMVGMVAAVNAIAESSAHVSKFVDDIARIASQTNMLSLNAEIEAARAGENGKGFTVVAEEVGKLADSSAALATEIATQIRNAIQQAEHGVASASLVNDSIQMIAASVAESDRLAQSIAVAMEQQRTNVAEINGKMGELTGIGQANASAATEIAATMQDLSRLAEETRTKVAQFNTTSGPPAAIGT